VSSKRIASVDMVVNEEERSVVWVGAGCTVSSKCMAAVDAASCRWCCSVAKYGKDRDCVEGG